MQPTTRRRLRFLLGFGVYFTLLWFLWGTVFIYPLQVFVVFLHEISHGLAAIAMGGSIQQITLSPLLGGACHCPGGDPFLTLSAGYLGSLAWGGVILEGGRRAALRSDRIVRVIGTAMIVLSLLYVRGMFGLLFGVLFGAGMILASRWLSGQANRTLLTVLGLTSCLYAVLDIKRDVLDRPHLRSDANMLAELTGVPTVFWGFLWITAGLTVSLWLFLRAYRAA